MIRAIRRLICALDPDWHPGFVRAEVSRGRRTGRIWEIARCVRCGEPEVW